MGIVHADKTSKEELGLMMAGALDLNKTKQKEYGKAKDSHLSEEEWQTAKTRQEEKEIKGEKENG